MAKNLEDFWMDTLQPKEILNTKEVIKVLLEILATSPLPQIFITTIIVCNTVEQDSYLTTYQLCF